jgi:ubiquinol-cytochrome c reductase cytochrome b subunit
MAEGSDPANQPDRASGIVSGTAGKTRSGRLRDWLDDRLGLPAIRYKVPEHANTFWYTLGGMTFMGLLIAVASGIWMAQYYNPDPAAARESVLFIQNEAPLGDIIRGIHIWSSYLVVIGAVMHMVRIFISASYKAPREVNWLVGVGLFGLIVFGAFFTGTVLRWDQEAYEALVHNVAAAELFGTIGGFFSPEFTTSVAILPRLYIAHVSIVPLLLVFLLVAHIFLIKYHGISPTARQVDAGEASGGRLPEEKETGRYPQHLRLMVGYGLVLLGIAGALAVLWVQPVGPAPDPTIEVTKPSPIFYWIYTFENWFGLNGILYVTVAFFGLLALVPFIDRTPLRRLRRRRVMMGIGIGLAVVIAVTTVITWVQPAAQHLG